MAEVETKQEGKQVMAPATGRGVAYPAFSLQEALNRARKFWDAEKKNAAPVSAAVDHWGYSDKSSGGKRTIAALIQYGLMTDAGTDANRTVKLSDRALTILLSESGSDMWFTAVREAAVSPKIYAELLSKWPAAGLPSDTTLQFYLVKDRNFNASTVSDFIKDFRTTVAFAKLDQAVATDTSNVGDTAVAANVQPAAIAAGMANTQRAHATALANAVRLPMPAAGSKQDVFTLEEGAVVLQYPDKMSATSYEDFEDWIKLQMRKIKRTVVATQASGGTLTEEQSAGPTLTS